VELVLVYRLEAHFLDSRAISLSFNRARRFWHEELPVQFCVLDGGVC
jgi:hypothetical protein